MRTPSWSKHGPRILLAASVLCLVACSSGGTGDPANSGGSPTGSSGTPAVQPGGGGSIGGSGSLSSGGMSGGGSASGGSGSAGDANSSVGGSLSDPCATLTCGAGQVCMNGACACTTGMLCSDGCFDTQSDLNHCGGCSTKCAADGACVSGVCVNPMCNPDTMQRSGRITTYNLATGMVACHYPTSTLPQYYGAMNEYDWNNSGVCGACVEITNSGRKVVVQITDECPFKGNEQWCKPGSHHIDLNGAAYGALGANNNPAVTWKYVPCTSTGNLKYYFDKAVQEYYLAVTPMNGRNVVSKMEVQVKGVWTALTHTNYNTYELTTGAGTGALNFRVTDIYNHVITDTVTMTADKIVEGTKQFAACP
ncbi:MAG: expansin EXLX1 family cellulose-binding protein [Pseudomonadota bacterium]